MNVLRSPSTWAWVVCAIAFASGVALAVLVFLERDDLPVAIVDQLPFYVGGAVFVPFLGVTAAIILRRLPRHPLGWIIMVAAGSIILDTAARWIVIEGWYLAPGSLPGVEVAAWFAEWSWYPAMMALLTFVPLLFPDGRPPSPRWRPVVIILIVWLVLATVGYAVYPSEPADFVDVPRAIASDAAFPLAVLMVLTPVAIGTGWAAVLVRRRRARGDEREQLRWMLWAAAIAVVGWAVLFATGVAGVGWGDWSPVVAILLGWGPLALVFLAVTIAIVKYRLYDIDLVINRTLVYGALTITSLAVYGAVVLAVGSIAPASADWRVSVLVVLVVAIAAYPLREWLQRIVNRLMYGDRDNPARAMSRLARQVADTALAEDLMPAVTAGVGEALRVPYVAVVPAGSARPIAAYGTRTSEAQAFPLVHQGEAIGTLEVGLRARGEAFSAADRRVLEDLARQVAGTVRAVQLAEDLQASREQLVLAREEERRRLRRDIHDGIGSALAALALQAGNLRRSLPPDSNGAEERVTRLEGGIRDAVLDIRRIVDDLRPPALDDLGLAGAIHERADSLLPGRTTLDLRTRGAVLPAALEVAAYRIATEAMTNAARHSGASSVLVRLDAGDGALRIEVSDDGDGMADTDAAGAGAGAGIGLRSMRERAGELGGSFEVVTRPGGGTTVRAALPIPPEGEGAGHDR
ncbi:sensor histidine kinase [Agromyces binzhouensis]|uniref:sensor histidine kinase n=1 Tax=Agromyces binzhouensis TaxID=1817495 RepID=UPI00362FD042